MSKKQKEETTDNKPLETKLFEAADKLRKNMDAAEYKHVVLGLIFLKYISDSFEELYKKLKKDGDDTEDKDYYLSENVFFVPQKARWNYLVKQAKQTTIKADVVTAMEELEKENSQLKGILPKDYSKPNLDEKSLGGLIDLIASIEIGTEVAKSQDILGRVYEYFLGEFALAEGKKGGQFYTPECVVKLLVEILQPYKGRVFDPCCGSGGMFVQSEKFVQAHQGKVSDIAIYGQESNQTTWKLCRMNLAIRGINGEHVRWNTEGSFMNDLHKDLKADFILANPPFNDSDWSGNQLRTDARWQFGAPPVGNANFAWIQHFIYHLSPNGSAGVVMHCSAASNKYGTEAAIRKNIVDNDLIDCMIALPTQLFYNTTLPVHIWIISRNKEETTNNRNRKNEILMIDAFELGHLLETTQRFLSEDDILTISSIYKTWKSKDNSKYEDIVGLCKVVNTDTVKNKNYILSPNRYISKPKKIKEASFTDISKLFAERVENVHSKITDISKEIQINSFSKNFFNHINTDFNYANWEYYEINEIIDTILGGEWGYDEPKKNYEPCKVVRGTDFPNIPLFNFVKLPTRYIHTNKIESKRLQVNDILIEMSGGSKNQPTGRSVFITEEFLQYFDLPVLFSNFCKLVRINSEIVNPYWFYLYWQLIYEEGLTTRYENQPSGIRNFQLDEFTDSETILIPNKDIQEKLLPYLEMIFKLKTNAYFLGDTLNNLLKETFEKLYNDLP